MRETRSSGSVRGASGDGRPYRERLAEAHVEIGCFRFCPLSVIAESQPQNLNRVENCHSSAGPVQHRRSDNGK
jgi:hypothetical protein